MTLHLKTCSIKYIERKPITLYEKTCLSVCRRRQCPIERGDPLEIERRDPVSTEAQRHRLGAKQELINTNCKQLAEEDQRLLQGQLLQQNLELREAHQRSLTEMEE